MYSLEKPFLPTSTSTGECNEIDVLPVRRFKTKTFLMKWYIWFLTILWGLTILFPSL